MDPCAFKHSVFKAVHVLENRDLLHGSHVPEMSRKVIPQFLVFGEYINKKTALFEFLVGDLRSTQK